MEKRIYELEESRYKPLRPDITKGVVSRSLIPEKAGVIAASLVRVRPGGEFSLHQDTYHHVLCFLEGHGEGSVEDEIYQIRRGIVAEIPAGMSHGYKNTGDEEMLLITVNISADPVFPH